MQVSCNGEALSTEVDTGAAVSVVDVRGWEEMGRSRLYPTSVELKNPVRLVCVGRCIIWRLLH